jgi:hypothetical protein
LCWYGRIVLRIGCALFLANVLHVAGWYFSTFAALLHRDRRPPGRLWEILVRAVRGHEGEDEWVAEVVLHFLGAVVGAVWVVSMVVIFGRFVVFGG